MFSGQTLSTFGPEHSLICHFGYIFDENASANGVVPLFVGGLLKVGSFSLILEVVFHFCLDYFQRNFPAFFNPLFLTVV